MLYNKDILAGLTLAEYLDFISDDFQAELVRKGDGLCGNIQFYKPSLLFADEVYSDFMFSLKTTRAARRSLLHTGGMSYPINDVHSVLTASEQFQHLAKWKGAQFTLRKQLAAFISYNLASIQL